MSVYYMFNALLQELGFRSLGRSVLLRLLTVLLHAKIKEK
jgi:hypothetical protein